ncbi:MAG: TrkA family potassium uptake protein [Deltaproteobacteria bacterium]|jgi:trk system potassium uptake protein TrkA
MRVTFIGAGEVTVRTAELLIGRGHEVIIIEKDAKKVEELSDQMDCSFLNGDGSNPAVLREVNPKETQVLFCLSDADQTNLIASLVGRSLGFERIITSIQNPAFEEICRELDLRDTIIPSQTISRYLADMVEGQDILELSTVIKNEVRFFSFTVDKKGPGSLKDMDLPAESRVVCYYRQGKFLLPEEETNFKEGDEVVIITHRKHISELRERWKPEKAETQKR